MEVVLATRNRHKAREFSALLPSLSIRSLPDDVALPPETGATFAENAVQKARSAMEATGVAAIADDSGICARALGGAPGVRSARFAGESASDEENLNLLIAELAGKQDRHVEYVCALALVTADGSEHVFEGRCEGDLVLEPRGTGGFGYDPCFAPRDYVDGRTMAELEQSEKDAISHRGRAASALQQYLEQS